MVFKKKSREQEGQNLLQMVPVLKEGLSLQQSNDEMTVFISRQSWIERQAVRFLKQPAVIQVKLDSLGAAVISRCDGNHTISDIAEALHAQFDEAAEPLIPRLAKFVELMEANHWIDWKLVSDNEIHRVSV